MEIQIKIPDGDTCYFEDGSPCCWLSSTKYIELCTKSCQIFGETGMSVWGMKCEACKIKTRDNSRIARMEEYTVRLRYECESDVKVKAISADEAIERVQDAINGIYGKELESVSNIINTEEYIEDTLYVDDDALSVSLR